ncbi:aspartate/glutamate racemase family protein [Pleionea litopenaei]|uniref:Amino acid racemase n=1 Tax=Pleionea litopenaei TaxID=3070815 RepID=A0AA51RX30_9GAMM|nr:amino acid racemase [Pleionea sp. HL-JVS1]WMS89175.1 amino acid racemase [Pleionea sp. HL-JVS1]
MKKLGLLGGTSWHSTLDYYRLINQAVQDQEGGLTSADLMIRSVNFAPFHEFQVTHQWDKIAEQFIADALAMKSAGVEALVICANTMHQVAADVEQGVQLPVLHIADALARKLPTPAAGKQNTMVERSATKLGVLGTEFTMEMPFYRDALLQRHIEMLVPEPIARKEVNRIIFEELVTGQVLKSSRDYYLAQVDWLEQAGAEAVVLGCTEIGMLLNQSLTSTPLIDSLSAHVEYIVEYSLDH